MHTAAACFWTVFTAGVATGLLLAVMGYVTVYLIRDKLRNHNRHIWRAVGPLRWWE